ncbi:MAG: glycosyltransferase family 2 protein [Lachnobacterium sp.]|nr:glycosyltransferase family 2 protein [Lachnobacterium sp.]
MKEKIVVTIVTPTYNRLSTLPRLLESLCHQTNNSFQWVIIDDGSTDDTEKFFDDLKKQEVPFEWEYHRKQNGGKHTALNACHTYIRGEVVLILDSDDYLTFDAVETIQSEWKNYKNRNDLCGMSYFKGYKDGNHLSIANEQDDYIDNDIHYRVNKRIKGDRCEIVRTDLLKMYPFPVHAGEKFFSESWLWNIIALNYKTVYRNKTIYICEYLEGGLTKSGRALRMKNPLGMMDNCRTYFNKKVCLREQTKEMLLYWVYARCAGYSFLKTLKTSGVTLGMILTSLPGNALYLYWKKKYLE